VLRDSVFFTLVWLIVLLTVAVELTVDERDELRALVNSAEVSATVATRARIVLWHTEDRQKQEIAALAGVSRPTVDLWLDRYRAEGVAGLLDRRRGAPREQVSAAVRARILAASRTSPPEEAHQGAVQRLAVQLGEEPGGVVVGDAVVALPRGVFARSHRSHRRGISSP
jgi:transposase